MGILYQYFLLQINNMNIHVTISLDVFDSVLHLSTSLRTENTVDNVLACSSQQIK